MLVPEIREQVTNRSGDVIAVLAVLVDALDANALRVSENELPHSRDHLEHPVSNDTARAFGQLTKREKDEIAVRREPHVGSIAAQIAQIGDESRNGLGLIEAARERRESTGL